MTPPIPVLLLKASSRSCSTSSPDPYAHLLSQPPRSSPRASGSAAYQPVFVPVFDTTLVDRETLVDVLRGGGGRWAGVVVTSQRAVEAWEEAGRTLAEKEVEGDEGKGVGGKGKGKGKGKAPEVSLFGPSSWSSTPFFSIGPSTTTSLLSLSSSLPSHLTPSPALIIGTDSSGNTPSLALTISSHLSSPESRARPLLYLTGDKNGPVLGELLAREEPPLVLVEQQTYATAVSPSFGPTLLALLTELITPSSVPSPTSATSATSATSSTSATSATSATCSTPPAPWIAVFSPSTLPPLLPILQQLGALSRVRLAAIGPTTRDAMLQWQPEGEGDGKGGLEVLLTADKPTAGSLDRGLRDVDGL